MEKNSDYRDTLYTVDKSGRRKWVYPQYITGNYFKKRTPVAYFLMLIYLCLPWVTIGGKQGVLLDIAHRRFIFFGAEFWATDTIFMFLVLGILAMSLFFFTSVFGRIWCGWACPETVFLEFLFRPIERLIEGSDVERRKLDASPWTLNKIGKKFLKHSLSAMSAWIIANTAIAYIWGRENVLGMMTQSPTLNLIPFLITVAFMLIMAFQFGWFREQFCTVLCPYARFQSVLMDKDSLLVGYDRTRGEPRGKLRGKDATTGDCIDCKVCIRVCPTGIDIRNGTQLECIACTACIDGCDSIMDKIGKPRGLIRYDSESGLNGEPTKILRARVFVYSFILLVLSGTLIYQVFSRNYSDMELVRSVSATPYSLEADNIISNHFSLRVSNKSDKPQSFSLRVIKNENVNIITPASSMFLKHGESAMIPVFIRAPQSLFRNGSLSVSVEILSSEGDRTERTLNLLGPVNEQHR